MNPAATAAYNTPPCTPFKILKDEDVRANAVAYMSPGALPHEIVAAQNAASDENKENIARLLMAPIVERPAKRPRLTDLPVSSI